MRHELREGVLSTRVTDQEEEAFRAASRGIGKNASEVLRSLAHGFLRADPNTRRISERDERTRELVERLYDLWRSA